MPLQLPPLPTLGLQATRAARPRRPGPQPLSPEEEQSLLGGMMSGLQWLGETFDKPGSAARGLLAGEPEQLLNLIPFSDTLGITSEQGWFADDLNLLKKADRVWGRDLLEQYAGAPKNIPGLFNSWEDAAWDVGGFITEVVTDPLMLVRGPTAALTKVGLRAKKGTVAVTKDLGKSRKLFDEVMQGLEAARGTGMTAKSKLARHLGTTPAEMAREIRSGERALFSLKMPFASGPFLTFGSGKLAAKMLEVATYGKYSPVRHMRGLLSPTAGGVYRGELQMAKDLAYSERVHLAGALMNMAPALNKRTADLEKTWMSLMKHHEDLGDFRTLNAFGRDMMETQAGLLRNAEGVGKLMQRVVAKVGKVDPKADMAEVAKFTDELHEYLGAILHTGDKVYERTLDLGLQGKMLQDNYGGHFARQPSNAIAKELSKEARNQDLQPLFGTFFQYALGRNPVIRNVPGMTKTVNDIAMDGWLTGVAGKRGKDFDQVLQMHMATLFPEVQVKELNMKQLRAALQERGYQPRTVKGTLQSRKELVKVLKELDPDLVVDGLAGKALQQEYLWKQHLEPALQKSLDDGVIDSKFYAQEVERFRRGLTYETLEKGKLVTKREPSAAGAMVDYFGKLPKEIRQFGLFDRRIIDDYFDYMEHLLVSRSTLETAHTFLHGEGVVGRASEGFEGVSLKPTWNAARLTDRGLETFAQEFAAKHGHQVDDIAEYAADLAVQPKMASALNAYVESMKPQVASELVKLTDKISATYRGWLTTPWPAFHARNMAGGIWQMWADGDLGFSDTMGAIRRAVAHVHSRGAKPLEYADEVFRSKLLAGHGWMVENVGQEAAERIAQSPEGFLGGALLPYKGLPAEELAGTKWRSVFPWAVRGGFGESVKVLEGGREVVKVGRKNILAAAGEKAYAFVEFTLRGGQYDALRRKGLTPAQAYHTVMRSQFNYCVDEETEILTTRGWLRWNMLQNEDHALTLDPVSREIHWQPIEHVYTSHFCGKLTRWKTARLDALTTSEHRWLAEGSGVQGGHVSIPKVSTHFCTTGELSSGICKRLILAGGTPKSSPEESPWSDEFVELVGWHITEGSITGKQYGIIIGQSLKHNPQYVERLRRLRAHFADQGATASEYKPRDNGWGPIVSFYFGKGIGDVIRAVTPGKQLTPDFLCGLTVSQLQLLYDTLMDGDGHRLAQQGDGEPTEIWAQQDSERTASFQMLAAMLGRRTQNKDNCTTVYQTKHVYSNHLTQKGVQEEFYDGVIWCPTTPSGTWMARRNGSTYWTGNSELSKFEKTVMRRLGLFWTWPRKNIPYQVSKLIGRPGGRTAQTMRALTSGDRDPEDYTPRYLREGLAVRISGPDDTANWLKYLGLPIEDLNKFTVGRGGFVRTAEKLAAEAHPLITLPIERFAQKELWSGRKLKDLRPITGDKMIDLMLHGGPGSRAVSEMRRLFDPRKPTGMRVLDFLTGAKFTTVDEPRQRARELRDIQEKRMQAKPYMREFTKPYVPRYLYDKMTPKQKAIVDKEKRDLQSLEAVIRSLPKP